MDKNPAAGENSSCNSLRETPIDFGEGAELPSEPAETSSKMDNGWGGARANSGGPRANSGGPRPGSGRKPKQRIIQRLPAGPRWYVVQTIGGQEKRVVRDLLEGEGRAGHIPRQSFEAYLPTMAVQRLYRGERRTVHVPMFSNYVLCLFERDVDPWGLIRQVDGVLQLLMTRTFIPIPLPAGFVEALKDTAADRLNLPRVRLPSYAPGQALRVESGPFAGHPAACVACDGLTTKVSIHLFGRDVEIVLPRPELSAVEQADRRPVHDREG